MQVGRRPVRRGVRARPVGVTARPRYSGSRTAGGALYAGGGQRGAHVPGSIPAPGSQVSSLLHVVIHGPILDASNEWEFDMDPALEAGTVLAFLMNPEDDHLLGISTSNRNVTDYTAQGTSLSDLSGAVGISLSIGDVVRNTGTWELVGSGATIEVGDAPPERLLFSDLPSGTFESAGKWKVPTGNVATLIERSEDQSRTGTYSLKFTTTAATAGVGAMVAEFPVPGVDPDPVLWDPDDYEDLLGIVRAWGFTESSYISSLNINALWYDSGFVEIHSASGGVDLVSGSWARAFGSSGLPPAESEYLCLRAEIICAGDTPAGETCYLDDISIR